MALGEARGVSSLVAGSADCCEVLDIGVQYQESAIHHSAIFPGLSSYFKTGISG